MAKQSSEAGPILKLAVHGNRVNATIIPLFLFLTFCCEMIPVLQVVRSHYKIIKGKLSALKLPLCTGSGEGPYHKGLLLI